MSYTITYRKVAVKHPTENKFLILSQHGDSNEWDYDGKRRTRRWAVDAMAGCHPAIFLTEAAIEANYRSVNDEFEAGGYVVAPKKYGFKPHWNMVKRAIKNAISFDHFCRTCGPNFWQWTGYTDHNYSFDGNFQSFERLLADLSSEPYTLSLRFYLSDWEYNKIYPRQTKVRTPRKGTHCVYAIGRGYVYKRSSKSVWFTSTTNDARQMSEKQAKMLAEKLTQNSESGLTYIARPTQN
jgi:hypothetical protein